MQVCLSRPAWAVRPCHAKFDHSRHLACRLARGAAKVRCSAAPATQLPPSLQTIVGSFQAVADPMQRYKQLLFYATKLDPLPAEDHTPENKVKGCVSQVWVVPRLQEDGCIVWQADSDSQLTKGLAALLVQGLSGCTPDDIVRIPPDFISLLGLQQSLTPSRNNGFLNMFKLMQAKSLELYLQQQEQQQQQRGSQGGAPAAGPPAEDSAATATLSPSSKAPSKAEPQNGDAVSNTPVADSMRRKLEAELQPVKLVVRDDSNQHAGHGGYKGSASYSGETHFNVEVVSAAFEGLTSIKRHRLLYKILAEEIGAPVHALSLVTQTPAEAGM